jgi:HAD superfamily hydrolase (TIGR01509 family)
VDLRAVVFDFDGVLVRSELEVNVEAPRRVFRERFLRQGRPLTKEELATIPGKRIPEYAPPFLAARGIAGTEADLVMAQVRMCYDKLWGKKVRLMPGVKRTVKILRSRGVSLAIVTMNRRVIVERFYHLFGLGDLFAFAVTGDDVRHPKPDPEAYRIARERLVGDGIPLESILAVEDTDPGLASAKAAGLRCAIVHNRHNQYDAGQEFSQADHVFPEIGHILSL